MNPDSVCAQVKNTANITIDEMADPNFVLGNMTDMKTDILYVKPIPQASNLETLNCGWMQTDLHPQEPFE